jgi:hypothetical protein
MEQILSNLNNIDFDNLIKSANDGAHCGVDCKKKQKETQLRNNLNKAENNMKNAPEEYEKAQEEYLLFTGGENKATEYKKNKNRKRIENELKVPLETINKTLVELEDIKKNNKYLKQTIYILEDNLKDENSKINDLQIKLDDIKSTVDTTSQKNKYEYEYQNVLNRIYKYNNYLFYILYVVSILVYFLKFGVPSYKAAIVFFAIFIYNIVVDYFTIKSL